MRSALAFSSALAGLALALALAACPSTKTPAGGGSGTGTDSVGNTGGAPAEGACASDDDCVVSCAVEGQCCEQLCAPCDQAYTHAALAALETWKAQSCGGENCPVAKCMAPDHEAVPRCRDGACVAELVPLQP